MGANGRLGHIIGLVGLVLAVAALVGPIVASASTSFGCRPPSHGNFPSISRLRASGTGCTTARLVATTIQENWRHNGLVPAFTLYIGGPDSRRSYRVRRGEPNPYETARCVSGRKLVPMELGS